MKLGEAMERGFDRMEEKQDAIHTELTSHRVEMAKDMTRVEGKADASHIRMDNHKKEHDGARVWWIGLWLTAIGSAISAGLAWFTKDHK
jgi:hypothetical protein